MDMQATIGEGARRYALRDWEGALESLRGIDATKENQFDLAYYLGLCHARLDHWDEALLYLEQVVTGGNDPMRISQCRFALAYVYSVTGRRKLAEYELGRILEGGFESVQVLSFLGYLAWAEGRVEEAVRRYSAALVLEPEYATALNGLGYILACEGRDAARALSYCRKAVQKRPDNAAYLDSLAWAYFRLGFVDEARDYIERALAQAPGETEILRHARSIETGEEFP